MKDQARVVVIGGGIFGVNVAYHLAKMVIWTSQHDLKDPDMRPIEAKVVIEDYVFIGPRAIILPGVTIGQGAVVLPEQW